MTESSRRIKWIAWATVACYILVAVCLTHMPHVPDGLEGGSDKMLHLCGYFLYAALTYIAIGLSFPRYRWAVLTVVLALSMWAALDEITQPLFGRDCDFNDWLADMTGVIVAVTVLGTLRWVGRLVGSAKSDAENPKSETRPEHQIRMTKSEATDALRFER